MLYAMRAAYVIAKILDFYLLDVSLLSGTNGNKIY